MPLCLSKQLIQKIAKTLTVYTRKKFKISRGVLDNWDLPVLGDPGADKGGEGKSKRAEKYIRNEKK